ncbi:MAG TPA: GNAT family N-acetyltransferase [Mycobacterium sp.]|nr:GNAT family N-acetyltransferase [Mycobacterium sp.]
MSDLMVGIACSRSPRVASGAGVGSVGFWTKDWRGEQVYEVGWMVVPGFQGRGIAVAATEQAIQIARRDDKHRFMHAFPSVENVPSNAICRKLGFALLEACEFEFPPGHFMTCNDWRLDLRASQSATIARLADVEHGKQQLRLVLAWAELHGTELLENWRRARAGETLLEIDPLR